MAKQTRQMKMHPALLWSVIQNQAGVVSKAIVEGAMNSVDAGAAHCDIELTSTHFIIKDDGKGFANKDEIESFFETFGTPHVEGDAHYGKFRMGRGQMFTFGHNVWRSGNFKMEVDLKPQEGKQDHGLAYELSELKEVHPGCTIKVKLYEELLPSVLEQMKVEVKKHLRFLEIPVTLNGSQISIDPATLKWDEVTDDAYIKRKASGGLEVYNLGVMVKETHGYYHGTSGLVVARKQLKLNFPRNDILSTCPVWKRINTLLIDKALKAAEKAPALTDSQRKLILTRLATGQTTITEHLDKRIITDVNNSQHKLSKLANVSKIMIGDNGDRIAEAVHTRKLAFVIARECAEALGVTDGKEMALWITQMFGRKYNPAEGFDREFFEKTISDKHDEVPTKSLNEGEKTALEAIRRANYALVHAGYVAENKMNIGNVFEKVLPPGGEEWAKRLPCRQIRVGDSNVALMWTDGKDNIWVNRKLLSTVKQGPEAMHKLSSILLHEYVHRESSVGSHDHGIEFYETFHQYALHTNVVFEAAEAMQRSFISQLMSKDKKVPAKILMMADNYQRLASVGFDLPTPLGGDADNTDEPEALHGPSMG